MIFVLLFSVCPKEKESKVKRFLLSVGVRRGNDEEQSCFYIRRDFSIFCLLLFVSYSTNPRRKTDTRKRKHSNDNPKNGLNINV